MTKRVFLVVWSAMALAKLALAIELPLFGDEAFYWLEGRHPAWSYSDLPPVTAWLAAIGSAWIPGEFGVRALFLIMGMALPWQVVGMTRRWYGDAAAWRAGILALLVPLASTLGVLALPDVPLAFISLLTVDAFSRALRSDVWRDWIIFGTAVALGLMIHYRFAVLMVVLAGIVLVHPAGRAALRGRKFWSAAAIAALGLAPLLAFNLGHDLAGLRFQLVDRHPWRWQSDGWLQLAEQMLVASPALLGLFAWTAWRSLKQTPRRWPDDVVVPSACGLWLMFFVLGFFADNERFRWHWPLVSYLLLLPVLASYWPSIRRWLAVTAIAIASGFSVLVLGYLAIAAMPEPHWLSGKRFPANFSGWREAAQWMRTLPEPGPDDSRWVADNFKLAAALRFYLAPSRDTPILVLDDALNTRHGRAAQLAIWEIDEAALASDPESPGWLVVEETARRFSDRWAWYQGLCARFSGLKLDEALTLHGGRKRFVRWRFDAYDPQPSCRQLAAIPPLGWVEIPDRAGQGEPVDVFGWVMQPELGIETVTFLIDGDEIAQTARNIDIAWVEEHWGEIGDPAGRRLGFTAQLPTDALSPGIHRLSVRVRRSDGREWLLHEQDVVIGR